MAVTASTLARFSNLWERGAFLACDRSYTPQTLIEIDEFEQLQTYDVRAGLRRYLFESLRLDRARSLHYGIFATTHTISFNCKGARSQAIYLFQAPALPPDLNLF